LGNPGSQFASTKIKSGSDIFKLREVIVMDTSLSSFNRLLHERMLCRGGIELFPGIMLRSLVDLIEVIFGGCTPRTNAVFDVKELPDQLEAPELQPEGGRDAVHTLLFTSGSSGMPKAVIVSARSFLNDTTSRNYVSSLVTVSYIPLSHSSDRMKLWEFLLNGGRIGIVQYDPQNWIDHERNKKTAALGSGGSSNGVEGLFEQVALPFFVAKTRAN
jgi:acyl-CoA synthetase (AMP-forming)/AMP-acid ligase II